MKPRGNGGRGEDFAADMLKRQGYRICAVNYSCRWGEIDIVAQKGAFLAFIEVKTRAQTALAPPACAVTRAKRHKIIAAAYIYIKEHPSDLQPRFDVFAVVTRQAQGFAVAAWQHYENAFDAEDYRGLF